MFCPPSCHEKAFIILPLLRLHFKRSYKCVCHVSVLLAMYVCVFSYFHIYGHLHSLWSKTVLKIWFFQNNGTLLEQRKRWWFLLKYFITNPIPLTLILLKKILRQFWNTIFNTFIIVNAIFYKVVYISRLWFKCFQIID